ncbi:retrovirus-related pol polyprotein from transposon TNT 1-94 [Tanacetum coccineum]
MNHQTSVLQIAYQSPQVTTQPMTKSSLIDLGLAILVFSSGDDLIACLNKAISFLIAVASSRFLSTNNQLRTSSNLRNQATIQDDRVTVQQVQERQEQSYSGTGYKSNATSSRGNNASGQARVIKCYNCQGEGHMARQCTQPKRPRNVAWYKDRAMLDEAQKAKQILDEEQLADPGVPNGQAVPHSKTYLDDMENQSVHAMQDFEQTPVVDVTDYEITSDSNNIPYSQYARNTTGKLTADLERYKERVKTFEQRLNIDLSSREKMIDSQMDDMIKEKLALKEQVDSLEQSKQIKEKESLLQTLTVFKIESKEKENKYMENEIDLEKKIKELDNIIFKALGYQNPFYLKKAQQIKPTLYDGIVIYAKHVAMHVIDDEETLILEEESRSKMFEKEKDPEAIKQNISHKPVDYEKLNRLSEDFGKRFTPQQELSAEQAFWLRISNPTSKPSDASPIKIEAPKELPKVSLVNESLKKLKFHLARFDNVVKIRTTPDARTEGEWGFEHTKAIFNKEIIPFLKSLKDIFNVFDKDLFNKIIEVQTDFDQMDAIVQQSSVDKQCLEIVKK